MRLTILGSGDASGIPRVDCADPACACARARAGHGPSRGNTCALVEAAGTRIAIDTGCGAQACDGLLLTHYHSDHAGRLGEFLGSPSSSSAPVRAELELGAPRAWGPDDGLTLGAAGDDYAKPLGVRTVEPFASVRIGAAVCTALPLNHPIPVHGWVIEAEGRRLAWLTDTYGIPARSLAWLAAHPCDLLCLDTTFAPGVERAPLKGHGDVAVSLAAIRASAARRALIIHVGHGLQTWLDGGGMLAEGVQVAADGMVADV